MKPRQKRLLKIAALWLLLLTSAALLAPWIVQNPYAQNAGATLQSPNAAHWFGTDALGRDLFARLLYGARVSLLVGIASAVLALIFGAILGAVSAYFGGWPDQILMRAVDVWYSFPALLLLVLLKEILERDDPTRGLWAIVLALAIYSWMHVARIVRGEVLRVRELPYIEAARSLGAGHRRMILRHLLPNTWGPLVVTLTLRIPLSISAESMLSFVGLGVKAPLASWGTLASEGWTAMRFFPHLIAFPSLALLLTILALNVLGEALQDRFVNL